MPTAQEKDGARHFLESFKPFLARDYGPLWLSCLQTWRPPPLLASALLCCHVLTLGHALSSLHPVARAIAARPGMEALLAGHLLKPARLPGGACRLLVQVGRLGGMETALGEG